jgi:hypothetical protein
MLQQKLQNTLEGFDVEGFEGCGMCGSRKIHVYPEVSTEDVYMPLMAVCLDCGSHDLDLWIDSDDL